MDRESIMWRHCVLWLVVTLGCWTLAAAQDETIYGPPKIEDPKTSRTLYVASRKDQTLTCSATGNPAPKYLWRYKGGNPPQAMELPDVATFDADTGTLTVKDFTEREEGEYQCLAFNEVRPGKKISVQAPALTLKVIKLDTWAAIEEKTEVKNSGEAVTLTCDSPPLSQPPASFKWFQSVQFVGEKGGSELPTDSRIYIDNQGNLHFAYVFLEDAKHYKCALSNSGTNSINLMPTPRKLEVIGSGLPETAPKIQFYTPDATAMRNEDMELECVFSGYPIPSVSWFDTTNRPIQPSAKYVVEALGRMLRVTQVQEEDRGIYTCRGSSSMGSLEQTIDLKVVSKPIPVNVLHGDVISPEFRDVALPCKTRPVMGADPIPAPVWTMNGEPFTADGVKTRYNADQTVLTIVNVSKPGDIACYRCEASNQYGTLGADGCLNVINRIQLLQTPPLKQVVKKGDTIDLTIRADTDVMMRNSLQTRASFRGHVYEYSRMQYPPFVTYDIATKEATINTSSLTDEEFRRLNGTYTLEVYHQVENKSVEVVVEVEEIPVIIIVPPVITEAPVIVTAGAGLWWIGLLVGLLVLLLLIFLIVFCCCYRRHRGVYPVDKVEHAHHLDPEKDLENAGFHDLSRAGDENAPNREPPTSLLEDYPDSDDDASLGEYGELDTGKFNEDGSFIGIYGKPDKKPLMQESTF